MQNDFTTDYNNLLNQLRQQLADLVAVNTIQKEQIEKLNSNNNGLTTQLDSVIQQVKRLTSENERLVKENNQLLVTNTQQNNLLQQLLGKYKKP